MFDLQEETPGAWVAHVHGTEDYRVEIDLKGKQLESWYCDCPYDGGICKHVVAVLLAIRENRQGFLTASHLEEILQLFSTTISEYAGQNVGCGHYAYIARLLRKIRHFPGGAAAVTRLAADFCTRYRRRPSMLEELSEF